MEKKRGENSRHSIIMDLDSATEELEVIQTQATHAVFDLLLLFSICLNFL